MIKRLNHSAGRTPSLKALCILTFIGSSAGFIGSFLAAVFYEQVSQFILSHSSWHSTEAISSYYFTLLMVLFSLSLIGAIRLWKLHRDGFYIYIASQLAILLVPVIWIDRTAFSYTNAIILLVFIFGYGWNLKRMN